MTRRPTLFLILMLTMAACGQEVVIQRGPTPTPDPLAFYAPTPISPGQAENPLEILYVPPNPADEAVPAAAGTVANILVERSGLAVQVIPVATQAEALSILCDTTDGTRFPAAWLNGPTAVLAEAGDCGLRVLKATYDGQDGFVGEVRAASPGGLNTLIGRSLCRYEGTAFTNFYNWALPVLAMQANNLDPTAMEAPFDTASDSLAVAQERVQDGTCYALAIPEGLLGEETDLVSIYTTPTIPIGMLFVPPEMLPPDRDALIEAYLEMGGFASDEGEAEAETIEAAPTGTPEEASLLAEPRPFYVAGDLTTLPLPEEGLALTRLVGGEGVAPVVEGDLDEMRDFMVRAGFDLESFALR